MPPQILSAPFKFCLLRGLTVGGREGCLWSSFGIGLLVAFWGLLRPCELAGLLRGCIKVPSDWSGQHAASDNFIALFSLIMQKHWKFCGRQQVSHISHEMTVRWLQWLCEGVDSTMRMFQDLRQQRRMLKIALRALGLDGVGLTMGSFRPGGASQLFSESRNVPAIQFLGRWRNLASLNHYIQGSMAAMVMFIVLPHAQIQIET